MFITFQINSDFLFVGEKERLFKSWELHRTDHTAKRQNGLKKRFSFCESVNTML